MRVVQAEAFGGEFEVEGFGGGGGGGVKLPLSPTPSSSFNPALFNSGKHFQSIVEPIRIQVSTVNRK